MYAVAAFCISSPGAIYFIAGPLLFTVSLFYLAVAKLNINFYCAVVVVPSSPFGFTVACTSTISIDCICGYVQIQHRNQIKLPVNVVPIQFLLILFSHICEPCNRFFIWLLPTLIGLVLWTCYVGSYQTIQR